MMQQHYIAVVLVVLLVKEERERERERERVTRQALFVLMPMGSGKPFNLNRSMRATRAPSLPSSSSSSFFYSIWLGCRQDLFYFRREKEIKKKKGEITNQLTAV
jgi:hypothetical protein